MSLELDGVNGIIKNTTSDGDVTIKGNDGGSAITALTLDMSDAGTATFNHDVKLGDNSVLVLGTGSDMNLFHDGSNSYIQDAGTGDLRIRGSAAIKFEDNNGSETFAVFNDDGAVELYHNNVKKLETTSTGIDITGGFAATAASTITTADNTDTLSLVSTDTDSAIGPNLNLYRNAGNGADADNLSTIAFAGNDDAGNATDFARITAQIEDASNGSEDVYLYIRTITGGTERQRLGFDSGSTVFNEEGVDVDFRVEGNGDANLLFVDAGNDKIGVGHNNPSQLFSVKKDQNTDTAIRIANGTAGDAARASLFMDVDAGGAQLLALSASFSTSGAYIADNVTFVADTAMSNGMTIGTRSSDAGAHIRFFTQDSESARIEGGGNLLIAQTTKETRGTTLYGTGANNAFFTATGTNLYCKTNDGSSSTTGTFISFFNNSSATGSITCTNTTDMVYGGTSDYRLKENQTEINDGITKLKQLKPYDFNWKHDSSKKVQGFFAHEFAEICPNGVVGNKDATETKTKVILDANGGVINSNIEEDDWTMGKENGTYPSDSTWEDSKVVPIYQEMDASKAIPVLTAALKEAVTKIETLETKVAALEG